MKYKKPSVPRGRRWKTNICMLTPCACVHMRICLQDITNEMPVRVILKAGKAALSYLGIRHIGTALTFIVCFLTYTDFRWQLHLNAQTGTAQRSPVYFSFHRPFITVASGKRKSTGGRAFGCPQHRDEWDAAFCVSWSRDRQAQQGEAG